MEELKRSQDLQRMKYNGKTKECNKTTTSRNKLINSDDSPTAVSENNVPLIKISDNAKALPVYNSVLERIVEDGISKGTNDCVKMDDLGQLQQDLEKLLSTCAVRHRILRAELENIDQKEERRENKKGRPVGKQPPVKRRKLDEKIRFIDSKNGIKLVKSKHYNVPLHGSFVDLQNKEEIPKVTIPKNDTSDKFWLSIEPYCADVTREDLHFLDELIKECSQETEVKIPELGEHYSLKWIEEMINQQQHLSSGNKTKLLALNHELKKNGLNAMIETSSSPLSQRLLGALTEETVITKLPSCNDKTEDGTVNINSAASPGTCMESRIKNDEQDIIKLHHQNKSSNDDILEEIKKCQQELEAVNAHNVNELKKLRKIVEIDLRRQEVKAELDKVDSKVLEVYNKILQAKQKQMADDEEKSLFKKYCSTDFENEAKSILENQAGLIDEFTQLSNQSFIN